MKLALYLLFSPAILIGFAAHLVFVFAWSGWIIAHNVVDRMHK